MYCIYLYLYMHIYIYRFSLIYLYIFAQKCFSARKYFHMKIPLSCARTAVTLANLNQSTGTSVFFSFLFSLSVISNTVLK